MGIIAKLFGRSPKPSIEEASRPKTVPARFRVQRVVGDQIYEAYAGADGVRAVETWEAYCDSDPAEYPGELRFEDSIHGNRGRVIR